MAAKERNRWPILVLRRADQWVAGAFLIAGLAALGLYWTWQMFFCRGLIEIDDAEPREIRFVLDINQADWPEIALLPGVGEQLAKSIVAHRTEHGPFRDLDQLDDVRGIGPRTLENMRPYLLPIAEAEATAGDDTIMKERES